MNNPSEIITPYFVKQFSLAIIKVIEKNKFNITQPKVIIDADLIPELSDELIKEYTLNEQLMKKLRDIEETDFLNPGAIPSISHLTPQKKRTIKQLGVPQQINPAVVNKTPPAPLKANLPGMMGSGIKKEGNGYEIILPYIEDYTVSRIQCLGPNKPLMIIKSGQKHPAKISLTKEQIHDVFQAVAEMAHIPLIEGPFKVALDQFNMEGVNARITDSKFIIKKNTAYSMLERNQASHSSLPHRPVANVPRRQ